MVQTSMTAASLREACEEAASRSDFDCLSQELEVPYLGRTHTTSTVINTNYSEQHIKHKPAKHIATAKVPYLGSGERSRVAKLDRVPLQMDPTSWLETCDQANTTVLRDYDIIQCIILHMIVCYYSIYKITFS